MTPADKTALTARRSARQFYAEMARLETVLGSLRRGLFLSVAVATLAGCSVPVVQRGDLPEAAALAKITPGKSDKAVVTKLIGSPSSVASFDPNTWYYISDRTKSVAFFKPETLDQQVVAIDFDDKGVVRDIRRRTFADREPIVPNPNATPAPGRKFSFLEQLIGNFGRFSAATQKANDNTQGGGTPQM